MTEDLNDASLSGDLDVSSSDGDTSVSGDDNQSDASAAKSSEADDTSGASAVNPSEVEGLTLKELNALTGKEFPSKDAALKSIKDTFDYVGKAGQDKQTLEAELNRLKAGNKGDSGVDEARIEAIEKELFFGHHPEVNREVAEMVSKAKGLPLAEVVNDDSYKSLASKVKTADESEQVKSVLQSNPRLGAANDKMANAKDLMKQAIEANQKQDQVGSMKAADAAGKSAVGSVIDAFDL